MRYISVKYKKNSAKKLSILSPNAILLLCKTDQPKIKSAPNSSLR